MQNISTIPFIGLKNEEVMFLFFSVILNFLVLLYFFFPDKFNSFKHNK